MEKGGEGADALADGSGGPQEAPQVWVSVL